MKITFCELRENNAEFRKDWEELVYHTHINNPNLVLLPELPFSEWIAANKNVIDSEKVTSAEKHQKWLSRLKELIADLVVYSRPIIDEGRMFNTAFIWDRAENKHIKIHSKYFFPEEEGFWEASWYNREEKLFDVIDVKGIKIGVLLCSEMWFTEIARRYGKQGMDLLLCPRATGAASIDQWVRCGQTLAIISGSYCISSNKSGNGSNNMVWGGNGWVTEPVSGNILGLTNAQNKFVTMMVDLEVSKNSKAEYPLYIEE